MDAAVGRCPFKKKKKYRVREGFAVPARIGKFAPGETLTFIRAVYSRYDAVTVYAFEDHLGVWKECGVADDVNDQELIELLNRSFAPLESTRSSWLAVIRSLWGGESRRTRPR